MASEWDSNQSPESASIQTAEKGTAQDWAIRFTKDGSVVFAKLVGRVVVLGFAFLFVFGGPYDLVLQKLGKDATWVVLFLLVTLTFTIPRVIRRLKREQLVISSQGIVYRLGFKEVKRIAFSELSGYRKNASRFSSGAIDLCSQLGAVTWTIPDGFGDPQDLVAALDRAGLKELT